MARVTPFPSFLPSVDKLKRNINKTFFIEMYHHDFQSEPTHVIDAKPVNIYVDEIDEHGRIIEIIFRENLLVFTEKNHEANISGNTVVFSSKHDNKTYWLIDFKDEVMI